MYIDLTKQTDAGQLKSYTKTEVLKKPDNVKSQKQPSVHIQRWDGKDYETEVVRLESPLGFWYTKRIRTVEYHRPLVAPETSSGLSAVLRFISYLDPGTGTRYTLEYPEALAPGAKIGTDARPWDILPGYQGFPDHFVSDLYREACRFWDTLESATKKMNVSCRLDSHPHKPPRNLEEIKKSTMVDLFGISGKPEIQPNNIKILSHGFDLKESFRKRPEKK